MLNVENLSFGFADKLLLRNVSFQLQAGQSMCLKTSLLDGASSFLKCMAGIHQPQSGRVAVNQQVVHEMRDTDRVRSIVYCYEHGGLISTFTVFNNIFFPMRYHGMLDEKLSTQRIFSTAQRLCIAELLELEPHQLNDVQTRLVNLLRALCFQPQVILLDELQAGMSQDLVNLTLDVLLKMQQELGFAFVMTTTAGDDIHFADRIGLIHEQSIEVLS